MDIPKEIQIAGKKVQIITDHDYCFIHKVYGQCQYDQNKIILDEVSEKFSEELREQILLHEVIHFINAILSKTGENEDKEDYVNPLSELLFQVFKQISHKDS